MKTMNEFFANKNKKMLVDGDLLAYKIASGIETPINQEILNLLPKILPSKLPSPKIIPSKLPSIPEIEINKE